MIEFESLTEFLRTRAQEYEMAERWPAEALAQFAQRGGWSWGVNVTHGGAQRSTVERLGGYIALARGDMSTALFVTQYEGAVDLIQQCENDALKDTWLPRYATGEALTSIGYSQLTTSRQGGAPAMRAQILGGEIQLDGVMPWVTGAPYIKNVACGAALDDGTQLLVLLPMDAAGISIEKALPLAALNSTFTCEVRCDAVMVDASEIIAGPVHKVLSERSALRLLLVSATGIGLARSMLDEISGKRDRSAGGIDDAMLEKLFGKFFALEERLVQVANDPNLSQASIDALRVTINDWLTRLAGVLMVAAKGSGFARSASAQRLAAEAMFFCVWSASNAIRGATVGRLLNELLLPQ